MCVFTHGGLQKALRDAILDAIQDAIKVFDQGSRSIHDLRENLLYQVYFLIGRVMQTVLAAMPGLSSQNL